MTDHQLDQMLRRAAFPGPPAASVQEDVMARLRVDDGRARRWRVFVQLMIVTALVAGLLTAGFVCWSLAMRDTTHSLPPPMGLFQEDPRP